MPNPKDFMDDEHTYVGGYGRRKPNTTSKEEYHYKPYRYFSLPFIFLMVWLIAVTVVIFINLGLPGLAIGSILIPVIIFLLLLRLIKYSSHRKGR